jgi:hypothetical protein
MDLVCGVCRNWSTGVQRDRQPDRGELRQIEIVAAHRRQSVGHLGGTLRRFFRSVELQIPLLDRLPRDGECARTAGISRSLFNYR